MKNTEKNFPSEVPIQQTVSRGRQFEIAIQKNDWETFYQIFNDVVQIVGRCWASCWAVKKMEQVVKQSIESNE